METIKINNRNVAIDFSNQFIIARIPENFKDEKSFVLAVSDILAVIWQKLNVSPWDTDAIAVSSNNKVVFYSKKTDHWRYLNSFFKKSYSAGFYLIYDNIDPELIIEKMKELYKQSRIYKCFYEVIIEPSAGSDISDVVKEMKSLSEIIGMPVRAKFNTKELRITPTTDIVHTVNCFWKDINTDSVHK